MSELDEELTQRLDSSCPYVPAPSEPMLSTIATMADASATDAARLSTTRARRPIVSGLITGAILVGSAGVAAADPFDLWSRADRDDDAVSFQLPSGATCRQELTVPVIQNDPISDAVHRWLSTQGDQVESALADADGSLILEPSPAVHVSDAVEPVGDNPAELAEHAMREAYAVLESMRADQQYLESTHLLLASELSGYLSAQGLDVSVDQAGRYLGSVTCHGDDR